MRQLLQRLKPNSGMLLAFFWICQLSIINCQFVQAQVSVNTDGSNAPASAMFEVKSTDKGLLPPRMTTAQMDAIANPATGLMLYNLDNKVMEYFDGSIWRHFGLQSSSEISCGEDFIDSRDNQIYPTVQISTQCWMKKNLNVGTMIAGANDPANNGIIEKYCYNNDAANCTVYGGLYQWSEMMQYNTSPGTGGICPTGWHIPTEAEWCTLTTFLDSTVNCNDWAFSGTNVGAKMKETGTTHWTAPNNGATNTSDFTALGAGYRSRYGTFDYLTNNAIFWSSSEYDATYAWLRGLDFTSTGVLRYYYDKTYGLSVRCVRTN